MGKKTPSPTFHSGKPATSETPVQIVSTIRGDAGLIRADDAQEAPATNDFDGDGKAGGSLPALSWQLAEVAYAACWEWSEQRCGGIEIHPFADLGRNDRLLIAIEADRCINEPGYVPTYFPNDGWESNVRNTLFASVVRAIAL